MPLTILLADDQYHTRAIVKFHLEQAGFQVVEAGNGLQAWEELQRRQVDLLITDMKMPGLSGIELCQKIRQEPRLNGLPVVMFTAFALQLDAQTREELGISRFETKPFSPRRLVSAVCEALAVEANS